MKNIAIFASGTGSNALKIIEHFKNSQEARIALVVSNKKHAPVLEKAASHQVPTLIITRQNFYKTQSIIDVFKEKEIDFIVLAGFMWLVPTYLVLNFENRILNIHPALLPKFGGKGMYGMNVHQAVYEAKETETGITIHYVNEHYDEGLIVFQAACNLSKDDTPEQIALKVRGLEHENYPKIIEELIKKL